MKRVREVLSLAGLGIVLLVSGCGGGGSSSSGVQTVSSPPPAPQFRIDSTLTPTMVGVPFSQQLTTVNGTPPITFAAQGVLLWGFTVSSSGVVSGTPPTPPIQPCFWIGVTATDSSTPPKLATATLWFDAAGMYSDIRKGQVGVYYPPESTVQFECSTTPVTWSLVSGTLPPGLQMTPFDNGQYSYQLNFRGTPTQAGSFNITVQAVDAIGRTAQRAATLNIIPPSLQISDVSMQVGSVGNPYDHIIGTSGGTQPYSFSITSGALAAGLQLNAASGEITGTPTTAGYYQFTVTATDATVPAFTAQKSYMMLVTPSALPPRNDTLADATPIFPGTYNASLSPYTDNLGNAAPDQDYYVLSGSAGDVYQIVAVAAAFPGPPDLAMEILDSSGTVMTTCNDPLADNPPPGAPFAKGAGNFTDLCMNHGRGGLVPGSSLTLQLLTNQSLYIHVFDFEGRARPDFLYTLTVIKQ